MQTQVRCINIYMGNQPHAVKNQSMSHFHKPTQCLSVFVEGTNFFPLAIWRWRPTALLLILCEVHLHASLTLLSFYNFCVRLLWLLIFGHPAQINKQQKSYSLPKATIKFNVLSQILRLICVHCYIFFAWYHSTMYHPEALILSRPLLSYF
jgi:hypothetical protein